MPGSAVHGFLGAAAAGVLAHAILPEKCPDRGAMILAAMAVGGIAGFVPDLLEPALNPNHRSFFHSAVCAALVIYGGKVAWDSAGTPEGENKALAIFALAFMVGYGSHLGADAVTPKSLPLLCIVL